MENTKKLISNSKRLNVSYKIPEVKNIFKFFFISNELMCAINVIFTNFIALITSMINCETMWCNKMTLSFCICLLTLPGILSTGLLCDPEANSTVWSQSPGDIEITVEWGYGQLTCNSQNICYGSEYVPDIKIDPQLKPVEIQQGVVLKFKPSTDMQIDFPILPYKVDEKGFLNCDKNSGFPIIKNETNDTIIVSSDILTVGVNYFIVDLEDHQLVSCEFGLRLNITVKQQKCWKDGDKCGGRGNCISKRGQPVYSCSCCDMFKGEYCDTFDSCLSRPCQNGAECQHKKHSYSEFNCNCRLGYHGTTCSERVENLCSLDLCQNNGTCTGNRTHFKCQCLPGFTGSHCEVNINECQHNPCQHGVCVDLINGFQCFCTPGYHGKTCKEMYDLCQTSPCQNNGVCIKELDDYRCECHPGHAGQHCTDKVDLCTPNPCFNHSRCSYDYAATCHCPPGYEGTRCEINMNECEPNPCLNGGTCKDFVNEYKCLCHELHAGPNCEYTIDMFAPFLQGKTSDMQGTSRSYHVENLYIVAGTLSGAILIVIIVLTTCYCRMHETYKTCGLRRLQYSRQKNEPRETAVDVSSVSTPRLSIGAIWEATSLNYDVNQLNSPLRQSLKPKNI